MILLFYFILLVKYLEDFLSQKHITNLRHITCAASGLPGQSVTLQTASEALWETFDRLRFAPSPVTFDAFSFTASLLISSIVETVTLPCSVFTVDFYFF